MRAETHHQQSGHSAGIAGRALRTPRPQVFRTARPQGRPSIPRWSRGWKASQQRILRVDYVIGRAESAAEPRRLRCPIDYAGNIRCRPGAVVNVIESLRRNSADSYVLDAGRGGSEATEELKGGRVKTWLMCRLGGTQAVNLKESGHSLPRKNASNSSIPLDAIS